MKPHIKRNRFSTTGYNCTWIDGVHYVAAFGETPAEAYWNWVARAKACNLLET